MARGEAGRGNIVALDASLRRARSGVGVRAGEAQILFFTGVRYQRMTGESPMPPATVRPAGANERRVEV